MNERTERAAQTRWLGVLAAALIAAAPAPSLAQSLGGPMHDRLFGDGSDEPSADEERLREKGLLDDEGLSTLEAEESAEEAAPKLSPEEALEQAYADLKSDEEPIWRAAQEKVTKAWSRSGSDSMDLLLERGRSAMQREDWEAADEHLTDLVNLAPDFAEGWNMRASANFHREETGAALADLANAIALEPRHFSAYSGLGVIFEQIGDVRRALEAHRAALEIHPHLETSLGAVRRLAPDADGRPI